MQRYTSEMRYEGSRFDLSGRVALVTGGSRGLGFSIARIFAEAGASVVICGRQAAELASAAAEIARDFAARVDWVTADLSMREQVGPLAEKAASLHGRVDILVANAGANVPQRIEAVTDERWDELMELNLSSAMRLTRALAPGMMERRWGRVIYVSSVLALTAIEGRSAYCAGKAALAGLARATAMDLGPFGITANCLLPGPFATDLPRRVLSEEQKKQFAGRTALGRWGEPDEIAGPALLLASAAGAYMTGSALVVDGGALARML